MRRIIAVTTVLCVAGIALAQDAGNAPDDFVPPPALNVPPITNYVTVFDTVRVTNLVVTTNRVLRREAVVTTNASLLRFVMDFDTNQVPVRFTSYLSDGSIVVTAAGNVASLSNRPALSIVNVLLGDVIRSGRRNTSSNTWRRAHGTNVVGRVTRKRSGDDGP